MRRNILAQRPKVGETRMQVSESPQRKVFKCIVDDTALMAGVKKSTRDGIRKWVSQGAINLYVPLHTLQQLHRLKKGSDRIASDAREAIKWLDDITSMPSVEASGYVRLEGGEEVYETWQEVEEFLLPETLLSMEDSDSEDEDDEYGEDLESSFAHLDVSDETSMSSTHSMEDPPKTPQSIGSAFTVGGTTKLGNVPFNPKATALIVESPNRTARNSTDLTRSQRKTRSTVPESLKPLFSHILWLIHKEANPDRALESYILLTNDTIMQTIAQKFGIRAKRLEQLRDAVGREDREFKNRMMVYKMESGENKPRTLLDAPKSEQTPPDRPKSSHSKEDIESEDEDVVLLKRAPRGPQAQGQRIFDPNDFGRSTNQTGTRGGRGGSGSHGRNLPSRGRGNFNSRGTYVPPAPLFRAPPSATIDPNQPIDPDSFARPGNRVVHARGNRRKLWEPN